MKLDKVLEAFQKDFGGALSLLKGWLEEDRDLSELVGLGALLSMLQARSKPLLEDIKGKLREETAEEIEELLCLPGILNTEALIRVQHTHYVLSPEVSAAEVDLRLKDRTELFFTRTLVPKPDLEERLKEIATPEEVAFLAQILNQEEHPPRVSFQSKVPQDGH